MGTSTATPMIHSWEAAPFHVQLHLVAAVVAVVLGGMVLLGRKGTRQHRTVGWIWVTLMLVTALTSFFIQARDRFSWIHVLSVIVLVSVTTALVSARQGHIRLHKICMISTFAGLVVAGAFTLLPYRMLGKMVFG
jgi:uncharacterized membrane protein